MWHRYSYGVTICLGDVSPVRAGITAGVTVTQSDALYASPMLRDPVRCSVDSVVSLSGDVHTHKHWEDAGVCGHGICGCVKTGWELKMGPSNKIF